MEILFQNPLFLVSIVLVILVVILKVILKPAKKKNDNNKVEIVTTEQSNPVDEGEKEDPTQAEIIQQGTEKQEKKKLRKLKPEITKVYEKKELKPTDESKNKILEEKSKKEDDILKSMQFVKSSKNIERLKPLTAAEMEERERLRIEQEMLDEGLDQIDIFDEKIDLKNKSKHFDRTRRLSKMIKEDSLDDMFCSHISEKYMNMDDLEKHLRNCDEIQSKLFNRVAETLVNSEIRLNNDVDSNNHEKSIQIDELERRKREKIASFISESNNLKDLIIEENELDDIIEEDVDLSAKNILIVDTILNRKGRKNNL